MLKRDDVHLRWIKLSPFWDYLREKSNKRMEQKSEFSSTRDWSDVEGGSHFVGMCAEFAVAIQFEKPMDAVLRRNGDGGADFENIAPEFPGRLDVKGTRYRNPVLKHPAGEAMRADWYGLVYVDLDRRRAALIGIVSAKALSNAPVRDWEHGLQHSLGAREVYEWYTDYASRNRAMQVCPTCGFPISVR